MTSKVPKWLTFFKDAGIPASVASNYAVAFCDHRIQDDMLADLTKEILRDIGVTVMGDIIAILRHAKQVHTQAEREKAAKSLSLIDEQEVVSQTTTPKKFTAASRMVDHWISNQRTTSPVSGTESPNRTFTKKRLAVQSKVQSEYETSSKKTMSERFSVQTIQQANPSSKKKISPKMQKISVRLPNDNKKVATKQKQAVKHKQSGNDVTKAKLAKKKSVFDRLGEEDQSTSKQDIQPPSLKPLKTSMASAKNIKATPSTTASLPNSVFSRLGNLANVAPTPPKATVQVVVPSKRPPQISPETSDDEGCDEDIDYTTHSVLRPPRQKQTVKVKPVKPVKPVKRTVGVVSQKMDVHTSKSVFSRLGPATLE